MKTAPPMIQSPLSALAAAALDLNSLEQLAGSLFHAFQDILGLDFGIVLCVENNNRSTLSFQNFGAFGHTDGFDGESAVISFQSHCLKAVEKKETIMGQALSFHLTFIPLGSKKEIYGVFILGRNQNKKKFSIAELDEIIAATGILALFREKELKEKRLEQIEKINEVVFEITSAIYSNETLDHLFASIHQSLGKIMDVSNFYIALYDKNTNILSFPFYRDEYDDISTWDIVYLRTNSLTNEVFEALKPVLLHQDDLELRAAQNRIIGTKPLIWAGVPLIIRGEVRGVLVVQSYSNPALYGMNDVMLLNSLSEQVALAIDRTAAFEKQAESEKKFRQLFNHIADPTLVFEKSSRQIMDCNDSFIEVYGYTREEILQMTPYHLHPKEELDLVSQRINNISSVNKTRSNRYRHTTKNGRIFSVAIRTVIGNYDGRECCISAIRDITEHLELEDELRKHKENLETLVLERTQALEKEMSQRILNETKYQNLFDSSSDAVFLFDRSGFLDCNPATVRLFGLYSKEEFLDLDFSALSPKVQPCGMDSLQKARAYRKKAYSEGWVQFEWEHIKYHTKEAFPADVLLNTMTLDNKLICQAVIRDITAQKQAQRQREILAVTTREMEIAKNIQTALLPSLDKFNASGFEISANMTPAEEVGGDYYDIILGPDQRLWFGVGDVTGHGLVSGLIMMMVQVSIHTLIRAIPGISPEDLLSSANAVIRSNVRDGLKVDHHMTISFIVEESDGRCRYAGAHETIMIFRAKTGGIERIPTKGMWLGIIPDISRLLKKYAGSFYLEPEDLVFLYTDGVTESCNEKKERYGLERMETFLKTHGRMPVETIKQKLLSELNQFMDSQTDDISFLILKKR